MNSTNSWHDQELDMLGKALTFAYKSQNTYKEPLDLKDRILGWRFVLEDEFSMDQVLAALKKFLKVNSNMPVPADIRNVLCPPSPRITEAQFIAAQEWQKRNGYPMFSEARDTITAYENQTYEDKKKFETAREDSEKLGYNPLKRIGNE